MNDETENEPKAKRPFQFTISHIIYVTVGVALVSALWRVHDIFWRTDQYIKFSLVVLYVIVFLKCFSAIPVVLKTYSKRFILYFTLGVMLFVHTGFALFVLYRLGNDYSWILNALFPFVKFVTDTTKSPDVRTYFDAIVIVLFLYSLLISQILVYGIIKTITPQKYLFLTLGGILSVHLFAIGNHAGLDYPTEYLSLFLFALFLFAFVKCLYFIPVIFERYNGKIVIHVFLALLLCAYLSYVNFDSINPASRSGPGVYTYVFPFASNIVYLNAATMSSLSPFFGGNSFQFMLPASLAQLFIYSIVLSISSKSKRFNLALVGIIVLHAVAVCVVFRMDSFLSNSLL